MYKIIIIFFIVLLTYALTNYSLKDRYLKPCKTEYHNSSSSKERDDKMKEEDKKNK